MRGSDGVAGAGTVRARDDGGFRQAVVGILGADTHVHVSARVGLGEETHEDNLLLESVKDGGNVVKVEGSTGQVRSARDNDLRLALTAQDVRES